MRLKMSECGLQHPGDLVGEHVAVDYSVMLTTEMSEENGNAVMAATCEDKRTVSTTMKHHHLSEIGNTA